MTSGGSGGSLNCSKRKKLSTEASADSVRAIAVKSITIPSWKFSQAEISPRLSALQMAPGIKGGSVELKVLYREDVKFSRIVRIAS